VPFLRVDSESEVNFYVFDAPDVACYFPRELGVGMPGFAHGEESGVCYGLRVGSYAIVVRGREIDVSGAKAGEDVFDFVEAGLRGAVFDEDLWMSVSIGIW